MNKKSSFLLVLLATAILALSAATNARAEWAEWIADADLRLIHDNNLNYSAFDEDKKSDTTLSPVVAVGRYMQLGDAMRLRLTVDVEAGQFDKFDKLNYTQVGATAALRHKLGLGIAPPWLRGYVSAASLNVDSDLRDSKIYEIGAQLGKRFGARFEGQVGLAFRSRDGKAGATVPGSPVTDTHVFDQDYATLSLEGGIDLTERTAFAFGYAYRTGEFTSSCSGSNVNLVLQNEGGNVKSHALDDAFDPNFCAYKLDGKTQIFSAKLSYSLGRNASLRVVGEYLDGEGDFFSYESRIGRLQFLYVY